MEEGRYMQQDAEEFFNILSHEIAQGLSMFHPAGMLYNVYAHCNITNNILFFV
jgi:hypothetical protein